MASNQNLDLSLMAPEMKQALQNMAFGEGASATDDEVKMIIQSALSRYLSGRSEFGSGTMKDMLAAPNQYYAVSNPNVPYQQASSGKFPDVRAKARYAEIGKLIEAVLGDKAYSTNMPQFYFTDEEEQKLRGDKNKFDFDKVKRKGRVGRYNTYGY